MNRSRTNKTLLLALDAFGTLFVPRQPIAVQYAEVARRHGLVGFTDNDLSLSFRHAFKHVSASFPNYGKAAQMPVTMWWAEVITKTFQPLLPARHIVPPALIEELMARFATSEGYRIYPDVIPFLRQLKNADNAFRDSNWEKVIVGVITNSDNRVKGILESLGITVGSNEQLPERNSPPGRISRHDIDFIMSSYDAGAQKPDRRIFDAAERLCQDMISPRISALNDADEAPKSELVKVYVGDELEKDAMGALDAGWNAVLLDRGETSGSQLKGDPTKFAQVPGAIDRTVMVIDTLTMLDGQLQAASR